jgi:hypothetical protein
VPVPVRVTTPSKRKLIERKDKEGRVNEWKATEKDRYIDREKYRTYRLKGK